MNKDQIKNSGSNDSRLYEELRKLSPTVTGGLVKMRQEAFRDKTVPAKYKHLTALTISIVLRCEPCIKAYVNKARAEGITQDEFIEFLEVAMTMQGCPGEAWALKAYAAFKEYDPHGEGSSTIPCCEH